MLLRVLGMIGRFLLLLRIGSTGCTLCRGLLRRVWRLWRRRRMGSLRIERMCRFLGGFLGSFSRPTDRADICGNRVNSSTKQTHTPIQKQNIQSNKQSTYELELHIPSILFHTGCSDYWCLFPTWVVIWHWCRRIW